MTSAEFHKQYDSLVSAFRRQLPDAGLRLTFGRECDAFFRQCALQVWKADVPEVTASHVEYYNAIYCSGNEPGSALFWELSGLAGEDIPFAAPAFFRRMCDYDAATGHSSARRFVRTFALVLVLFAASDGKVSEREAALIQRDADALTALCDERKLPAGIEPVDVHQFVTGAQTDIPAGPGVPDFSRKVPDLPGDIFNPGAFLPNITAGVMELSNRIRNMQSSIIDPSVLQTDLPGMPPVPPMPEPFPTIEPASPAEEKKEEAAPAQEAAAEEEPLPTTEELLAELDELCGLEQVKKDVHSLINLVKVRKLREENDLPVPPLSLHMVFMGNPGTGKTTVARLLAKIYRSIGVLSKGQLVEVDRSGLVAGFVGQTALKTGEVVQSALGGVLFIDEAYALAPKDAAGNDFGREAIEVLLKGMEDNRKDMIVIVAGYTDLMDQFLHSNPGLESRFNKRMFFEDYNGEQLMEIFRSNCRRSSYTLSAKAEEYAAEGFLRMFEQRDENFGNARDVRNIFERAVTRQADRVAVMEAPTKDDLMAILVQDLDPEAEPEAGTAAEETAAQPADAAQDGEDAE